MNLNSRQRAKLLWMGFRTLFLTFLVLSFIPLLVYTVEKYGKESQYSTAVALIGVLTIGVTGRWILGFNRETIADPSIPKWLKTSTVLLPAWIVIVVGGGIFLLFAGS